MYIILLRDGGGTRTQFFILLEVYIGGLGIGMSRLTLDTKTSMYTDDQGLQVPIVLEHDYVPHTYNPHTDHIHTNLNCGDMSVPRPSFNTFRLLDLTALI